MALTQLIVKLEEEIKAEMEIAASQLHIEGLIPKSSLKAYIKFIHSQYKNTNK